LPILKGDIQVAEGEIIKISEPHDNAHGDGGDICGLTVTIKLNDNRIIECGEKCSFFQENSIGKKIKVKFDNNNLYLHSNHNKILSIENKKINNYLGQAELMIIVLFFWGGLFLYIAYRDIKNEYKRQVEKEEKRKNTPPSKFNYDKY